MNKIQVMKIIREILSKKQAMEFLLAIRKELDMIIASVIDSNKSSYTKEELRRFFKK